MGFFDRLRRRRPTSEQEARLARITNPQQRAALLKAIADGDIIPEYAWEPLPTEFDTVAFLRRADQAAATGNVPVVEPAPSEASRASGDDVDREIVRCADMLRPTATAATDYLSASIDCPVLASARVFTPLLAWAFFNPFGPTLCALHLVRVPGTREHVIFFRSLNPFATSATAHGLVPEAVAQDTPHLSGRDSGSSCFQRRPTATAQARTCCRSSSFVTLRRSPSRRYFAKERIAR